MFENFNYKVLWLYPVYMSLLVLCCPVSTKLCFYKKINLPTFNMSWIAHGTIFITGNIAVHVSFHEPCTPCLLLRKEFGTVQQVPSYERTLLLGSKSHIVAVVVNEAFFMVFLWTVKDSCCKQYSSHFLSYFFVPKMLSFFIILSFITTSICFLLVLISIPVFIKVCRVYLVNADLWNSKGHSLSLGWNKTDTSLLCLVFMSTFIVSSDKWTYT